MNKRLKAFLPAVAVIALLAYNPAAAQDDAADGTATEAAASAEDDGSAFDEFAAENSEPATVTVSTTPPPAKSAAPVSPAAVREPRGASEGLWYSLGWRWGFGLSSFNNHRPLGVSGAPWRAAVGPGVTASLGLSGAATSLIHVDAIKTDVSITMDAQLTGYSGYAVGRNRDSTITKSEILKNISIETITVSPNMTGTITIVPKGADGKPVQVMNQNGQWENLTVQVDLSGIDAGKIEIDVMDAISRNLKDSYTTPGLPTRGLAGLLSVEFPILARLDNIAGRITGPLYIELGPQFGWNAYARYILTTMTPAEGGFVQMLYRNGFQFGPVLGAGANFGDWTIGVRAFYDAVPYSYKYGGHPWALQAGMTKYFWDY